MAITANNPYYKTAEQIKVDSVATVLRAYLQGRVSQATFTRAEIINAEEFSALLPINTTVFWLACNAIGIYFQKED